MRIHLVDVGRGSLSHADHPRVDRYAFTASLAGELAHELGRELLERLPPPDLDRGSVVPLIVRAEMAGVIAGLNAQQRLALVQLPER